MIMLAKIINAILILVAVFMGIKQGIAMVSGKPEMLELFGKWHFSKNAVMINGFVTIVSALMILHPRTFVWGNFLMAATILMIICFHLQERDFRGVLIELPFFALNLLIIVLRHPLTK